MTPDASDNHSMLSSNGRDKSLPRPLSSLPEGYVPPELQERLTKQEVRRVI